MGQPTTHGQIGDFDCEALWCMC